MKPDLEEKAFASQAVFEAWLRTHHKTSPGIWLTFPKKGSGIPTVTYAEAVEIALCYGWIDGQAKTIDETWYKQRYVPRRPKSVWSKINVGKVEALIAAGKMQPAGQAAIDAAKADGRWDAAYDAPTTMTMPADFKAALAASPKAQAFYNTLNKTNIYTALWQVQTAIKPETRARRIAKLIAQFEEGKKLH